MAGASQVLTPYEPMTDWQEDGVTWSTKPALASSSLGTGVTFDIQVNQWKSFPLSLAGAQKWFNGTSPHRGIVVKGDGSPAMTLLEAASSEAFFPAADRRPKLVLVLSSSAVTDTTPPVISNLAPAPSETSATIAWTTDEPADSMVEYGLTAGYGQTAPVQAALVTDHAVALAGLSANTTYHFRVMSKNAANLTTVSADGMFQTTLLLGDVNRDGQLTSADVIELVKQLLGLQPVTLQVSDLNGDGRVTLGDVQALANRL